MVCIEKIYSVSALVGNGDCNANCKFCAGKYLRSQARNQNPRYWTAFESAIKLSSTYGGWSLSLTSGGEPTCDPDALTKALRIYDKCVKEGKGFPNVTLFTNGIRFDDKEFCNEYLDEWKNLGLTNVALSIHGVTEEEQAEAYNVESYPNLETLIKNINDHGLAVRATLLLRKGGVDNAFKYKEAVDTLINKGIDNITSWNVGKPDATRNEFTPSRRGMISIRNWLRKNAKKCHGHSWGGGVYDYNGNILRITDYVTKHKHRKNFVRQLVVFQDAVIAYSWIRKGALCMKY